MRTSKAISTISFNTTGFLIIKLQELQRAGVLSFWAFVCHLPEDDEGGLKEHHHLYVEPSRLIQTDDLRKELAEPDPIVGKPRGTLSWVQSKFGPWYMYALHDKRYLASKGQARKYHYSHEEVITSDQDDLVMKARSIDMLSLSPYADMAEAIQNGTTWPEYFARGTVPIPQIRAFEEAWRLLSQAQTIRYDREPHDMEVPTEKPLASSEEWVLLPDDDDLPNAWRF